MEHNKDGWCGKTCRAPCPLQEATTSEPSSKASSASKTPKQLFLCRIRASGCQPEKSGDAPLRWAVITPSHGVSLTRRRVGESHKDGGVYLLSSILMDNVPDKYSLSPKACQGILRRAQKRGKELPEVLRLALERQAANAQQD